MNTPEKMRNSWDQLKSIIDLTKKLHDYDNIYWLDQAMLCFEAVYGPLAPFQIEDKVEMVDPPDVNPKDSPGWMAWKHSFVKGAKGTIADLRYEKEGYSVGFTFDFMTWIDTQGKHQQLEDKSKGIFWLHAKRFKKVDTSGIVSQDSSDHAETIKKTQEELIEKLIEEKIDQYFNEGFGY